MTEEKIDLSSIFTREGVEKFNALSEDEKKKLLFGNFEPEEILQKTQGVDFGHCHCCKCRDKNIRFS